MEQKHEFQTEVSELLHLMIHSLYSNKEIFLRELISNASDALDKLNYLCLTDDKYKALYYTPKINIEFNKDKKTLIISDNGIGMDKEDLINNLGTIARSGTKGFLSNLSGDIKKDSNLIGQFGVGFYSAFMVADKIEVMSKKALSDDANIWKSDATNFSVEPAKMENFGTKITLYMKNDEFLDEYTLENIIKKYSNHIPYPIFMDKSDYIPPKDGEKEGHTEIKNVQVNKASALWQMPKSALKPADYNDFYKQISHDSKDPLLYIHTKAEGKIEYSTLFYIPSIEPFDLYRVDYQSGVKLYVKRVFITDDEKELLPSYLRFVRGIIDVEDLPLNVSREILQENIIMQSVKEASIKKILSELKNLKEKDFEKYLKFYSLFGKVLKEGLYGFTPYKDEILDLALFKSNKKDGFISLKEYKENMQKDQKEIYYITGKNANNLKNSPLLENFNKNNIEVLICDDEIDAIIMPMVYEYDKTPIKPVTSAEFKEELNQDDFKELTEKIKEALKDEVKDVRVTSRLNKSASCLVYDENDPDFATQQILKQMGQDNLPKILPILEINPNHEIIKKLKDNNMVLNDVAKVLLGVAKIQEGITIENTDEFTSILTSFIQKAI